MNATDSVIAGVETRVDDAISRYVTERYEQRGRELWGLARRLGATDEQAADVVQETHLRLWRELTSGARLDDVDAWTFRVAYRLVMDQHRVGRRVRDLVGRLTESRGRDPVGLDDTGLSLWPMVDRLPARERATLYLRYRADLTFDQIGEVMGITPGGARAYASRGVERLRAMFTTQDGDDA
jgi:RNA polymerase sigma-70 factor (ECF subfamily)